MYYISLGSNCSVSYHLNLLNLRTLSLPFDWCRISILQLIDVLNNNFYNFADSLIIKKFSNNHENSFILSNSYNIHFAHELITNTNLDDFKIILNKRINNFINLKNCNITFIRIELSSIKKNYIYYIFNLVNLLNKFFNNFILKLIINTNFEFDFSNLSSNVRIYKFYEFSVDWKMIHIDWKYIIDN